MDILVAGDFVSQKRVAELLIKGNFGYIFDSIKGQINKTDFSIVNLEAPIVIDNSEKIKKCGPNLKVDLSTVEAIKYLGFKGVTLANNHLRDYGDSNVVKTIDLLNQNGIKTFGAGLNLSEASRTKIIEKSEESIAVINCCEHESSIATNKNAGANPINVIAQTYAIKEAKEKADYVIVIVHGGIEMYNLPTPRMQELYRFYIDMGADAVVNHHQHCYSGYEIYHNKPIFYGIGNFCFDWPEKKDSLWFKGYMVRIFFDKKITFELIPYEQCFEKAIIRPLDDSEKIKFYNDLQELNGIISSENVLTEKYEKYLKDTRRVYKAIISPYSNRILQSLFIRNFLPGFMTKIKLQSLLNNIECESHRERFVDMIKDELK